MFNILCICVSEARLLCFKVLSAAQVRICAVSPDYTFAVPVIHTLSAEIHRSESVNLWINSTQTLTDSPVFPLCRQRRRCEPFISGPSYSEFDMDPSLVS